MTEKVTQERLKELFEYNPETGIFIRRTTVSSNARRGDVAGCINGKGYLKVNVDYKSYSLHRLAWLYIYGKLPIEIDHINRKRKDNRIGNLREVSRSCNIKNAAGWRTNTSGVRGIYWHKRKNKWRAYIWAKGKELHLGYYENFVDAIRVRAEEEFRLGWPACNSETSAIRYLNNKEKK